MEIYDLIILGGGPAGYNAAERAGAAGLRTVLFEKRALGGVCLNEGCIPSKALLYSAKILDGALHGAAYGVHVSGAALNQKQVVARKDKVVKQLVQGVSAKLQKYNVTVVRAAGYIAGRAAEGFQVTVGDEVYTGKHMLLATGSEPVLPDIPGLKKGVETGFVLTNREVLALEEIPKRLVILGGGVVGMEMASYYRSAGSEVTVIEMLDHIGGPLDEEIAQILLKNYTEKGIDFRLNSKVTEVEEGAVLYQTQGGSYNRAAADKLLCAIGRRPVVSGFGLENLNVYLEKGAVVTDEQMRTNVPGLYAAGDVNGKSMLAHTAYREGEVAVNHMLGKQDQMRYQAVPSVIYTNPEVACVGETETSARAKGFPVAAVKLSMRYSGRYLAENERGNGICKLVFDKRYRQLLGVHMITNYASEIIYGAALIIEAELPLESLKELIFPHPTVGEVIREALFDAGL